MKTALLIGTGSRWGIHFTRELIARNYEITLISSSTPDIDARIFPIDYGNLSDKDVESLSDKVSDRTYDLIFFNHNSGGGPNEEYFAPDGPMIQTKDWTREIYVHCMFPALFLRRISKTITEETKIGWMVTGMIKDAQPEHFRYGLYGSAKYINLSVMRLFSQNHPGIFFGLNPWWFPPGDEIKDAQTIVNTIENIDKTKNGICLDKEGNNWY